MVNFNQISVIILPAPKSVANMPINWKKTRRMMLNAELMNHPSKVTSLVAAYSIVVKYSVKNGFEKLLLRQFKDSLDSQINKNVISTLKEEEWLLDSVGLGILRNNNLLPTVENPIKTKDVYEAFIRFDDKPMISGVSAVQTSLLGTAQMVSSVLHQGMGRSLPRYISRKLCHFLRLPIIHISFSIKV